MQEMTSGTNIRDPSPQMAHCRTCLEGGAVVPAAPNRRVCKECHYKRQNSLDKEARLVRYQASKVLQVPVSQVAQHLGTLHTTQLEVSATKTLVEQAMQAMSQLQQVVLDTNNGVVILHRQVASLQHYLATATAIAATKVITAVETAAETTQQGVTAVKTVVTDVQAGLEDVGTTVTLVKAEMKGLREVACEVMTEVITEVREAKRSRLKIRGRGEAPAQATPVMTPTPTPPRPSRVIAPPSLQPKRPSFSLLGGVR